MISVEQHDTGQCGDILQIQSVPLITWISSCELITRPGGRDRPVPSFPEAREPPVDPSQERATGGLHPAGQGAPPACGRGLVRPPRGPQPSALGGNPLH